MPWAMRETALPSLLQLVSVKADSMGSSAGIDWKETLHVSFFFPNIFPPQRISHVSPAQQETTKSQIQFGFHLHLQSLYHLH